MRYILHEILLRHQKFTNLRIHWVFAKGDLSGRFPSLIFWCRTPLKIIQQGGLGSHIMFSISRWHHCIMLVRTWTNMFGFQELFAGVHVFELNASVSKPLGRCSDLSPPICPICPICPIACSWFILSAKACLLTGSYTDISLFQVNAPRGKHSRSLDFSEALDPPPSDSEARLVPRQVPLHPVHRINMVLGLNTAEICDYACIACIVVSPIEWKNLTHQYSPASPTSTPRNNRTKQMKIWKHLTMCIHVSMYPQCRWVSSSQTLLHSSNQVPGHLQLGTFLLRDSLQAGQRSDWGLLQQPARHFSDVTEELCRFICHCKVHSF